MLVTIRGAACLRIKPTQKTAEQRTTTEVSTVWTHPCLQLGFAVPWASAFPFFLNPVWTGLLLLTLKVLQPRNWDSRVLSSQAESGRWIQEWCWIHESLQQKSIFTNYHWQWAFLGQTHHTRHMIPNIQLWAEKTLNKSLSQHFSTGQTISVGPSLPTIWHGNFHQDKFKVFFLFCFFLSSKTFDQNEIHFLDRYKLANTQSFSWHLAGSPKQWSHQEGHTASFS